MLKFIPFSLILVLIPLFVGIQSIWGEPSETQSKYPLNLCFIPEMEKIPEFNDWPEYSEEKYADNALSDWEQKLKWVEKQITDSLVKALSKWAKTEMQNWHRIHSLDSVSFKPCRISKDRSKVLFEGTVDTLPTHSQIVTRWLKLFLMYDINTQSIIRATVTIRGQILE